MKSTMKTAPTRSVHARARGFHRDEDGSMLLFGMFIFILMIWIGGIAIDTMRAEYTRVTLQNTLDRAVLAAADLDNARTPNAVVTDYFNKADLGQYLKGVEVDDAAAGGQLSYRRVSATAYSDLVPMFIDTLGFDKVRVGGASTAEEGITNLEISLIVDVSGSMGNPSSSGKSKLYELQEAAKQFGWHMLCNPHSEYNSSGNCSVEQGAVSISLVPYAEQVTVDEDMLQAIETETNGKYDVTEEHLYSSCVTFQNDDFNQVELSNSTTVLRTGHFDPWSNYDPYYGSGAGNSQPVCRTDDWRKVRPFVGHHSDLNALINNLRSGGNTSIDIGMKWGTALLDPDMRPVIEELADPSRSGGAFSVDPEYVDRPYDYERDHSMKVVVLMTDGVNTNQHYLKDAYRAGPSEIWRYVDQRNKAYYSIYNPTSNKYYYTGDGNWYDEPYGWGTEYEYTEVKCKGSWWKGRTCTYTTVSGTVDEGSIAVNMTYPEVWAQFSTDWYTNWSWLNDPVLYNDNATKNNRLNRICSAAKREGIIIYTIGFEVPSSADSVMSKCASTPAHYFPADGQNLAEVFGVISSSINQLRLTQ